MSYHRESQTHGKQGTHEWVSWHNMIQRCCDPKASNWKYYGARGISVCERWRNSYQNFLADMGRRPQGYTLDRWPDRNGNYEPGNCRWASPKEQSANRRTSRDINTHCRHGHEYTEANTYTYPDGKVACHVCKTQRTRESNERIRMNKLKEMAWEFSQDVSGQDLAEYSLILLFVALACIATLGVLGREINVEFSKVAAQLT